MTKSTTPFDTIINSLQEKIFSRKPINNLEKIAIHQLPFLRIIYINMLDTTILNDAITKRALTYDEITKIQDSSIKVIINYDTFINEVNKLGRLLNNDADKIIPHYYRIRFFRNKVVEHWDDYIKATSKVQGAIQQKQKIALPAIHSLIMDHMQINIERKKLISLFKSLGISLELDEKFNCNNPADVEGYNDIIYTALEKINKKLKLYKHNNFIYNIFKQLNKKNNRLDKKITKLLFNVGFPRPINDIEQFSIQLTTNIKTVLKLM